MADYNKVGLLTLKDNCVLLCRKKSLKSKLILPGGCVENGESDMECLRRELYEELGDVSVEKFEYIGTYEDKAANDNPAVIKTVCIKLYKGELAGVPVASSEIAELVWFGADSDKNDLSPILVNKMFPALFERGLLPFGI